MPNSLKQTMKSAFLATLPVMAGYLVLGMGFGILMRSKGYGIGWSFAMSLLVYAGSMQYLAVDLLASGASVVSAALSALMVNARHLFYGVSMLDKYKDVGAAKPYLIFSLTDETYSLLCSEKREGKLYYLLVSLFDHIYWVSGSVLGAVAGAVIPFRTDGIDFALTALFITVFVQQWKESRDHTAAVIGIAVSLVCLILFGPSAFLIPAMVAITVALLILGRLQEGARNV